MSYKAAVVRVTFLAAFSCSLTQAQWLNYPTLGIPRTQDGKPNLSAAVPKTTDGKPDLSGIWSRGNFPDLRDVPLTVPGRSQIDDFRPSRVRIRR